MGWQDQGYNQGDVGSYFANPAALLRWSVPLYRSASLNIRLHFWFILVGVFLVVGAIKGVMPYYFVPLDFALMVAAVLFHELGHRIFSRRVGGDHWEWLLWPLGGMIPPTSPHDAWSTFVANIGGIAFSVPLGIAAYVGMRLIPGLVVSAHLGYGPFDPMVLGVGGAVTPALALLAHCLSILAVTSAAMAVINLFPAFWFDGGPIWQSILWPKFGVWKATLITCMAGMILSVPFFGLALFGWDFLGMAVWFLIFADCFQRRRMLTAAGPSAMEEEVTYNYMDTADPRRKRGKKRWAAAARKRARAEQAEQARIDAILDKVKERGLHSLTWGEKRALKKATERQRERDLARRN
jgi:Zn-dependent protease